MFQFPPKNGGWGELGRGIGTPCAPNNKIKKKPLGHERQQNTKIVHPLPLIFLQPSVLSSKGFAKQLKYPLPGVSTSVHP